MKKFSSFVPPHFKDVMQDFLEEQHTYYWLAGGRGSIKSSIISAMIIIGIMRYPDSHAVCLRRYKTDLHTTVYSQIVKTIEIMGVTHLFRISKADQGAPPITYIPTGQKIYFTGMDDPEGLRGITPKFGYLKYSWFEEVHQMDGMAKIRNANQSIRRGSDERFITFYSYNPPRSKANWVNEEYEHVKTDDRYYTSLSNWEMLPKKTAYKWLGKDWVEEALATKKRDIDTYTHEYLGIPVGYGTDVFNNIEVRPITVDDKRHFRNIAGGLDWGFATDPAAFTMSNYDARTKTLYIYDEIYGSGISNYQLGQEVLKMAGRSVVIADSAEPKSIVELRDMGVNIIPSKKGKGSVEFGTRNLQSLNKIIIDPETCPNAAREFINAEYELDRYGNPIPRVKDVNNHAIDGVRYRMELETGGRSGWN